MPILSFIKLYTKINNGNYDFMTKKKEKVMFTWLSTWSKNIILKNNFIFNPVDFINKMLPFSLGKL